MRRQAVRSLVVAIGLCAVLAAPSTAGAATQLGETFPPAGGCVGSTALQSGSPDDRYTVPAPGVITAWSFQASASPPTLEFKVARPLAGSPDTFTIIGESELKATLPNQLNTYTDIQIPVLPGDVIGAYYTAGTTDCARMADAVYEYHSLAGDQPPGTTAAYSASESVQLDIAATLEPDCDADGLGDETQDPSLLGGECPIRERTLNLSAGKKRVKKGTKVLFSGHLDEIVNEPACESGQVVELQRKKPKGSTFTAFDHVTTFASGDFATDVAVRRTYLYVAVVTESGGCGAQVSPIEKVKVKKKKRKKGKKK
jgi:hypothetical protein